MATTYRIWHRLVLAAALATSASGLFAQQRQESAVHAAFLLNFTNFMSWPSSRFEGAESPLRICVLGSDEVAAALIARGGRQRSGRPVRVLQLSAGSELADCHLAFIGFNDQRAVADLLKRPSSQQVVTVGLGREFIARGGVIALIRDQQRVRLRLHERRANAAGVTVSSKLLELAEIARDSP